MNPGMDTLISLPAAAGTQFAVSALGEGACLASPLESGEEPAAPAPAPRLQLDVPLPEGADWLDGWQAALNAAATHHPLPKRAARHRAVAIVGYPPEAAEPDRAANVAELRRLLDALGLELVSVWPDAGGAENLTRAQEAGTVVSLPHGRAAGRTLAVRLGARLLELDLPLGIAATLRFVWDLAAAYNAEPAAYRLAEEEVRRHLASVATVAHRTIGGRTAAFVGDPLLLGGVCETAALFGLRVELAALTAGAHHLNELRSGQPVGRRGLLKPAHKTLLGCGPDGRRLVRPPATVIHRPPGSTLARKLDELEATLGLDLVVGDDHVPSRLRRRRAPLGFPRRRVGVAPRPWLGVSGALELMERLISAASGG